MNKILFLLSIGSFIFTLSCSTNVNVKNSTGAAFTATFDAADATSVANGATGKKNYVVGFFEPSKTVAVKAQGVYVSATSNVKVDGIQDVEVTFSANQGGIKVVNNSGRTITNINISPNNTSTWGSNWLGSSTLSSTTGTEVIYGVAPGLWDIRITDASFVGTVLGFTVSTGSTVTRTYGTSTISAPPFLSSTK
ncbi:MAG: hypothetical protein JNM63_13540 [Spirochaetia bacterium]|nr:hypothetical protein [Spirochaetia bacterium]